MSNLCVSFRNYRHNLLAHNKQTILLKIFVKYYQRKQTHSVFVDIMAEYGKFGNEYQRGYNSPRRGGHSYRENSNSGGRGCNSSRPENSQNEPRGNERRHPPHLTGKAIGLYYRDLAKNKKHDTKHPKNEKKPSLIGLDPCVYENVETILNNTELPSAQRLTSDSYFNNEDTFKEKYSHMKDSHFKKKFIEIVHGDIQKNIDKTMLKPKLQKNSDLDEKLKDDHKSKENSREYNKMLEFRSRLPAHKMRQDILKLIAENQVVVISGETGCGKTTQVAQFILDDAIQRGDGSITKIVCTQPRRISAVSVAERVATERNESLGRSVGYQIRLEKVLPRSQGSILFCTTGLLLQHMQGDPALLEYSHIILDEIHERNTESDFIITLLKQIIPKRRDLKVILMSATLDSDRFSSYYNLCPNIHIPGFTYPVTDFYLEDVLQLTRFRFPPLVKRWDYNPSSTEMENRKSIQQYVQRLEKENKYPTYVTNELRQLNCEELSLELIRDLLEYICSQKGPGAILVFLPGMMDIQKLTELLNSARGIFPPNKVVIYPLHSRLPTIEQKLIFNSLPDGKRKIIIATSIAEASITIEDVVYVVDCGRAKLKSFDTLTNIETLEAEWITLANVKQRRGRAGRVQPGECYHLFMRARESTFAQYPPPEMLRTPLEQVILQTKLLQLGDVTKFLSNVMDPPDLKAIELALDLLRTLDALDDKENLTPLGYHLAKLPLDPRIGKMIIWASLFSCVDPVLGIAAGLAFKDPFYCPFEKRQEARLKKLELTMGQSSDHIAVAEAVKRYESCSTYGESHRFCDYYFLSWNTLKLLSNMKREFARHLHEMKFLDSTNSTDFSANRNSGNFAIIKAVICIGLYPNVANIMNFKASFVRNPVIETKPSEKVKIHPGSINATTFKLPTRFLTFYMKQKSTAIFLHDTTFVSWTALFFAAPGYSIRNMVGHSVIEVNESVKIFCETESANLIQRLRNELDALLENKITNPCTVKWHSPEGHFLKAVIATLSQGYPLEK